MSQTLTKNYIHIIFSTKERANLILDDLAPELFKYIIGICKNLECHVDEVGGYKNHIHILCRLSKKVTLVELVYQIKLSSSKWMRSRLAPAFTFHWQNGYAAFSIGQRDVDRVRKYIARQYEHHTKQKFEDELRNLLAENNMEFNEQYLWRD